MTMEKMSPAEAKTPQHIDKVLDTLRKRFLVYWQEKRTEVISYKITFNQGGIMRCRESTDREIIIE